MTFAPATARAEDDEKSIWNLDKRIMEEVLFSFGLTKRPKLDDQIDYHERPRLTVPSGQELPAPKAVDPAVARRQQKPKPKQNVQEFDPDEFTNPIAPRELRASSGAGAPNRAGGSPTDAARPSQPGGSIDEPLDPLPPSRLGSSGGFFGLFSGGNSSAGNSSGANSSGASEQREQSSASAAEPPRRSLIDPPPGYQVRSANQPYGDGTTARAGNSRPKVDHAVGSDQGL
jgi:hypothetical protein